MCKVTIDKEDEAADVVAYASFRFSTFEPSFIRDCVAELIDTKWLWPREPNRVGGEGGKLKGPNYRNYAPGCGLLPTECEQEFQSVGFHHLPVKGGDEAVEWTTMVSITIPGEHSIRNYAKVQIGLTLDAAGCDFGQFSDRVLSLDLASSVSSGEIFRMSRWAGVTYFVGGLGFSPQLGKPQHHKSLPDAYRSDEIQMQDFGRPALIRTVFPVNLLPNATLDMPYGKTTQNLREYLGSHPGTLELRRFNKHCWLWRPAPEWIESLRESLFRGGRLWYFPCQRKEQGPPGFYRPDLTEPWEYHGELPENIKPGWTDLWARGITP